MAEEEEIPELTTEEKLDIARKLLLQSPPGEILQVASDVKTLLGDDKMLNEIALEVFKQYNTEQMIVVTLPDSEDQALVTAAGEIDATHYLDPRSGQVLTVDHIKQACTEVRPAEEKENTSAEAQPYRKSLQDAVTKYVKDSFPSAEFAVYGAISGSSPSLTLCISSSKFSPKNYWNGRWRSTWTASLSGDKASWSVTGAIQVVVHYFEEGNVQLDTKHDVTLTVKAKDEAADADALTAEIAKTEQEYLANLEETYSNLSETTFKDLRRTLPVTRTKFPWAQVQHSLATELKRNAK